MYLSRLKHANPICMLVGFLFLHLNAFAQYEKNYKPRQTYSDRSLELITGIRNQQQDELDRIKSKRKSEIIVFYQTRTNDLVNKVREKAFIEDDSLQHFVEGVFKRITSNNTLYHPPKRILILKRPDVNAFCLLEGTLVVNIGLLARIRNESQLAFALAHEIAHFELDHPRKSITRYIERRVEKNYAREMSKVLEDDVTVGELDSVRKFVYGIGRYSRRSEKQADSLGFILFRKAGYNQSQAIAMLSTLDSAEFPKYASKNLFAPLQFSKFPFKDFWLNQRPRIYSKKYGGTFIFDNDSLNDHPDMLMRKSILYESITDNKGPMNYQPLEMVNAMIMMSEFEAVESAYVTKQYDRCLFLGLSLLNRYPGNTYLVKTISQVFIDLLHAMEDGTINKVIPSYTSSYSEEFRKVNNFIHNITSEELGELTFHFLNNQSNFKSDCEDHYYLLWQICTLTHRASVKEKVKQSYIAHFPSKNAYSTKMR